MSSHSRDTDPAGTRLVDVEQDLDALLELRSAWPSIITTLDRAIAERRRILRRAHTTTTDHREARP